MLALEDLHVSYGNVRALQGTSLHVDEGEIVSLVGHNGVGKSTTLKAVAGLVSVRRGTTHFAGRPLSAEPEKLVSRGIAYVPEDRRIFTRLSVEENLRIGLTARRDQATGNEAIERELNRFPVLREMMSRTAGDLSGGQQQMLTLSRALVCGPKLLLLDEPSLGLAPRLVDDVFSALEGLREEGVTVLLVEQNAAKAIRLADRAYVMTPGGRIALEGTREDFARPEFRRDYLRLSSAGPPS